MQFRLNQIMRHFSLNNLGSIWYCIIATCVQIYIITRSIYRFTAFVALPWPNGQPPANSIHSYMLFIGCSIIVLPFFIVVGLIKIGNYSNDGRKVGIFNLREYSKHFVGEHSEEESEQRDAKHWTATFWKHSLPMAPLLHLLISFCFLIPRLITESQLIRHGFISKADIWKTDLDVLTGRYNGKRFNFFGLLQTVNQSEHRTLFSNSATLGQFFIKNSKSLSETFYELDESGCFSVEFANLLVALFILTIRYPAVFWRINKCFSALFSIHLLLNLAQSMIIFGAFQVTFKIFVCDPTHLMIRFRESSSLSLVQLSLLFFAYFIVLHLSSLSVHIYGMQKYREYRYARTKYLQSKYESKPFYSYVAYLLAMIFFLALSCLVGPLFYEFVIVYCGSLSFNALLVILSTMCHFACWIIIWLCLALKTNWTFDYDDYESDDVLLDKAGISEDSSLVVISMGKMFRVKEQQAKQTILDLAQGSVTYGIDQENCSNLLLDRNEISRYSFKSARSEHPYNGTFNKNSKCRYSTRSYRKSNTKPKRFNYHDVSDSEGEYTTFRRMKHTNSFKEQNLSTNLYHQQSIPVMPAAEHFSIDVCQQSPEDNEPTYGFHYMFNPLTETENETITPISDKGSDTSSGIHSGGSNSSLTFGDKNARLKSNSLESLMNTLQKLEEAAADKPNLRSLSSLQRSVNILNRFDATAEQKKPHVNLTSFVTENSIYGTRMDCRNEGVRSTVADFAHNPDYTKYYLP